MDLYLFDFDETLYDYNFRIRLPALSLITGVSQYRLAKDWWTGGFERRAEAGEWSTADEYIAEFNTQTGAQLTLEKWRETRMLASTRISASVEALRRAASLGTVGILTNNPSPFAASFAIMAPDVAEIVIGDNVLVSSELGVRKPDAEIYHRALKHFNAEAKNTFFTDDSTRNVEGAVAVGIHAYQIKWIKGEPQTAELDAAITAFAERARD